MYNRLSMYYRDLSKMFRNVLYNPFYAFPPLKATAPLTRTLIELGTFHVK